jgi:hypothetical protein
MPFRNETVVAGGIERGYFGVVFGGFGCLTEEVEEGEEELGR